MPEIDAFLAQVPAQVDFATITQAKEIDQAGIGVFQFATKVAEFVD